MCYGYNKLASMQGAKDFYEDNIDDYDEAREEAWNDYVTNTVMDETSQTLMSGVILANIKDNYSGDFNACDLSEWLLEVAEKVLKEDNNDYLAELYTRVSENLEDFEFPDEDEWIANKYEGTLGDIADQCYEEARDRAMGL